MSNAKQSSEGEQHNYRRYWLEVKKQAEEKCELGNQLSKEAAWEMDLADTHLWAADQLPYLEQATGLSDYPRRLSLEQRRQLTGLGPHINYSGTSVISTASVSGTFSYLTEREHNYIPLRFESSEAITIEMVTTEFEHLFERHNRKGEVLRLMKEFGFEQSQHGNSAIQQFQAAWDEHERLPATPTASLIPLREALRLTVDEVLQRRQFHHKGKVKDKLVEIGSQAAASGVTAADFQRLQDEWDALWDHLSNHKEPRGDRQTERALMIRGTSFLIQLLEAVDSAKLRTP